MITAPDTVLAHGDVCELRGGIFSERPRKFSKVKGGWGINIYRAHRVVGVGENILEGCARRSNIFRSGKG